MLLSSAKQLAGAEIEFHILDSEGFITAGADELISKMGSDAKKECAKSMIELNSKPGTITETMRNLLEKMKILAETAERCGMKLFYHSAYPGSFNPEMRKEGAYGIKEKVFGTETWRTAGRCIGFHFHCTLPKGIFSVIRRDLKLALHL